MLKCLPIKETVGIILSTASLFFLMKNYHFQSVFVDLYCTIQ